MARTKISEFSANPSLNTDIDGINIAEGCPPSGINDAIRELMSQLKDQQTGASGDPFNVGGNLSVTGTTSLTGAATLANNPTLSAGTANGVAYLNGSKVLTSGSALTYNGGKLSNSGDAYFSGNVFGSNGSGYWVSGDGAYGAGIYGDGATGNVLRFQASGSEQARLTSTGLGIGVSSPGKKLDVVGTIRASDGTNGIEVFANIDGGYIGTNTNKALRIATNNTEVARFDASGNLGLGVTPSAWGAEPALELRQAASLFGFSGTTNLLQNAYYNGSNWIYKNSAGAMLFQVGRDGHRWFTAPSGTAGAAISFTQAMTLTAAGDLLVGRTSQIDGEKLGVLTSGNNGIISTQNSPGGYCFGSRAVLNSGVAYHIYFMVADANVGGITSSGTSTTYATSSDYRLKEDIQPMTGALAKVAALKPRTYKWKSDGSDGEGFIAHELQEVCPDAVTGEKDAVDADGKPVYQGIDTSFLVATLAAAIQELKAIVDQQAQRISQLEGASDSAA